MIVVVANIVVPLHALLHALSCINKFVDQTTSSFIHLGIYITFYVLY